MGRVLADRLWRARNREERSDADTDPGRLGGGGENRWSTRRHSLLYCHCASDAHQQPQRAHLPLPVRFVHRFLLDRVTIRFSGPPFTTADRGVLCKPIGQIAECPEEVKLGHCNSRAASSPVLTTSATCPGVHSPADSLRTGNLTGNFQFFVSFGRGGWRAGVPA